MYVLVDGNFDDSHEMTGRYNVVDYLKSCFNLHVEAVIRLDLKKLIISKNTLNVLRPIC